MSVFLVLAFISDGSGCFLLVTSFMSDDSWCFFGNSVHE